MASYRWSFATRHRYFVLTVFLYMPNSLCSNLHQKIDLCSPAFSFCSCYEWKGSICLLMGEEWGGVNIFTSASSCGHSMGNCTWFVMLQAFSPVMLPACCMSLDMVQSISLTIFQLVKLGIIAHKPFTKSKLNNCDGL